MTEASLGGGETAPAYMYGEFAVRVGVCPDHHVGTWVRYVYYRMDDGDEFAVDVPLLTKVERRDHERIGRIIVAGESEEL